MSVPPISTVPLVARSSPAISRISVVLPEPDSPTMPNRDRAGMERVTSDSASTLDAAVNGDDRRRV